MGRRMTETEADERRDDEMADWGTPLPDPDDLPLGEGY